MTRTRADAVRNYEAVLKAATAEVAEHGPDAAVPDIAARAGVGKGTVYRCFPTKEHLVGAVVAEKLRAYTKWVDEAAERPDAWAAFTELLEDWAARQAADSTFTAGLAHESTLEELCAAKAEMLAALDRLMDRAKAEGAMRPDATGADVRVLFGGMARLLRADGDRDPATWRRYAGLVADALRA